MYSPKLFQVTDSDFIAQLIADNSFGTLISNGESGLQASHLPFDFDPKRNVLRCHMARANSQWRDFAGQEEVLAIFQGAHGYISPRWYQTQQAVPTWNYIAIHVYGKPTIIEDDEAVVSLLEKLVAKHEAQFDPPWTFDGDNEWQQGMRRAIVGFEMTITRIEGKAKMSQNRPTEDRVGVMAGLEAKGETELADWVRRLNQQITGELG